MRGAVVVAVVLAGVGCRKPAEPLVPDAGAPKAKAEPLAPVLAASADGGDADPREALFVPAPFTPAGPRAPETGVVMELRGETVELKGQRYVLPGDAAKLAGQVPEKTTVLLVPDEETYLAQVQPLLALLDDGRAEVWLKHPLGPLAYPVKLQDEPHFNAWLDEPVPGKLRIIQRADGFELQTNLGKVPGADPNGPTVPARGGQLDLATLQRGLDRVKRRFRQAPDVSFLPSYGTTLEHAVKAISTNWLEAEKVVFAEVWLVYPRPRPGK